MSSFQKAEPVVSSFFALFYGLPGSGKTFTALQVAEGLAERRGKRIAFIDTEGGTRPYRKRRPVDVHPEPFDFDVLETRSVAQSIGAIESLDPKKHGVLVIDSISHIWDACQAAVSARTRSNTIRLQDWAKVKAPMRQIFRWAATTPIDVIFCGRQKTVFEEGPDGSLKKVGHTVRSESETGHEPDVILHFEANIDEKTKETHWVAWGEKDRWGLLAGKHVVDPSFDDFSGYLDLLGIGNKTPAPSAHSDDDLASDVASIVTSEEIEQKSEQLLAVFDKSIAEAENLEQLQSILPQIKAHSEAGDFTGPHLATLRKLFNTKQESFQ